MNQWPQENVEFAKQDRDTAWQAYIEMFEAARQRGASQADQAPGPVYAANLHEAHQTWWNAQQNYQQMLAHNDAAEEQTR